MTTKMEAALVAGGVNKPENDLLKALALWRNRGGTYQRGGELLAQAFDKGRGQVAADTQSSYASPPPVSGGHSSSANHGRIAAMDGAGPSSSENHLLTARPVQVSQHSRSMPAKPPSPSNIAAMKRVKKEMAHALWDRTIGGELRLRNSTKVDWINYARKFNIGGHICRRMVTEIAWPDDDKTPLEKVATEKQVRDILESGPMALRMLEGTHA